MALPCSSCIVARVVDCALIDVAAKEESEHAYKHITFDTFSDWWTSVQKVGRTNLTKYNDMPMNISAGVFCVHPRRVPAQGRIRDARQCAMKFFRQCDKTCGAALSLSLYDNGCTRLHKSTHHGTVLT